ncbi:L,D-transpeptidase family protein [Anaeroselena agilis]|uniref:L,D-transpeptidase family protein n=1 Tax=Anaeroselena agilis TaxID=3063788 RepID=A0ABU3NVN3_9FIRM|nr:L,D-transpeptidase family protein [Selenomonadales bacterium 4137-cl]
MLTALRGRGSRVFLSVALLAFFGLLTGLAGFEYWDERELAVAPGQPQTRPEGRITLVVNVPARYLEVLNDGKQYKKYRIAVGRSDTPSPFGEWIVTWKAYHSGDIFGTRFLGLNVPWGGYGIHGTNRPWSIGQFASKGCIRMRNRDIEELFEWVPVGTPVRIEGSRIRIARPLRYTAAGPDVVMLQMRLRRTGYYEGRADGLFSREIEVALKRFQHDKGLKPTGIADRKTLELLGL